VEIPAVVAARENDILESSGRNLPQELIEARCVFYVDSISKRSPRVSKFLEYTENPRLWTSLEFRLETPQCRSHAEERVG
jgi:hypothetical protein